jgi:hypothetical protein
MKRIDIGSAKLAVVFPEGKLPAIDPNDPSFVLFLGGFQIAAKVNPKAARISASSKRTTAVRSTVRTRRLGRTAASVMSHRSPRLPSGDEAAGAPLP